MRISYSILIALLFCNHGYAQSEEGKYVSSDEKLHLYKYFLDEEIAARASIDEILDNKPAYISIAESPFPDNIFTSFSEETAYQAKYTKWIDDCLNKLHADTSTMHPHGCDSLFYSRNEEEIGGVSVGSMLKHDSLGLLHAYLYKDGVFEDRRAGYWVGISKDGGKQWEH